MGAASQPWRLSARLSPVAALQRATDELQGVCSVAIESQPTYTDVSITPLPNAPDDAVKEWLNFALCAALEIHLS